MYVPSTTSTAKGRSARWPAGANRWRSSRAHSVGLTAAAICGSALLMARDLVGRQAEVVCQILQGHPATKAHEREVHCAVSLGEAASGQA